MGQSTPDPHRTTCHYGNFNRWCGGYASASLLPGAADCLTNVQQNPIRKPERTGQRRRDELSLATPLVSGKLAPVIARTRFFEPTPRKPSNPLSDFYASLTVIIAATTKGYRRGWDVELSRIRRVPEGTLGRKAAGLSNCSLPQKAETAPLPAWTSSDMPGRHPDRAVDRGSHVCRWTASGNETSLDAARVHVRHRRWCRITLTELAGATR